MQLKKLNPNEMQAIKKQLDKIPNDLFDIENNYVVIDLELPIDFYNMIVELSGSNDEIEISYTITKLLYSYINELE